MHFRENSESVFTFAAFGVIIRNDRIPAKEKERMSMNQKTAADERYVCIDIETSGETCGEGSAVMLSAVRILKGRSIGKFRTLMDPGCEVSEALKTRSGITAYMLDGAPTAFSVFPSFITFIGADKLICCGKDRTLGCMERLCKGVFGAERHFEAIDIAAAAGEISPELAGRSADELAVELFGGHGIDLRVDTRADVIAKCYEYLKYYCIDNGVELPSLGLSSADEQPFEDPGEKPAERTARSVPTPGPDPEPEPQPAPDPHDNEAFEGPITVIEAPKPVARLLQPETDDPDDLKRATQTINRINDTCGELEKVFTAELAVADTAVYQPAKGNTAELEKQKTKTAELGTFAEKQAVVKTARIKKLSSFLRIVLVVLTACIVAALALYAYGMDKRFLLAAACMLPVYIAVLIVTTVIGRRLKKPQEEQ